MTDEFTVDDFTRLSAIVIGAWASAVDRDWSVPAGAPERPMDWTCLHTADHTIDCVFSYALFLASGNQQHYPRFDELRALPEAGPADMVEGLRAVSVMLASVITTADPASRSIIVQRPQPRTAPPSDFAARGGLELILHAYDVCSGLGVSFDPPADLCERLWATTTKPEWRQPEHTATGDAWSDLLERSGRPRRR